MSAAMLNCLLRSLWIGVAVCLWTTAAQARIVSPTKTPTPQDGVSQVEVRQGQAATDEVTSATKKKPKFQFLKQGYKSPTPTFTISPTPTQPQALIIGGAAPPADTAGEETDTETTGDEAGLAIGDDQEPTQEPESQGVLILTRDPASGSAQPAAPRQGGVTLLGRQQDTAGESEGATLLGVDDARIVIDDQPVEAEAQPTEAPSGSTVLLTRDRPAPRADTQSSSTTMLGQPRDEPVQTGMDAGAGELGIDDPGYLPDGGLQQSAQELLDPRSYEDPATGGDIPGDPSNGGVTITTDDVYIDVDAYQDYDDANDPATEGGDDEWVPAADTYEDDGDWVPAYEVETDEGGDYIPAGETYQDDAGGWVPAGDIQTDDGGEWVPADEAYNDDAGWADDAGTYDDTRYEDDVYYDDTQYEDDVYYDDTQYEDDVYYEEEP